MSHFMGRFLGIDFDRHLFGACLGKPYSQSDNPSDVGNSGINGRRNGEKEKSKALLILALLYAKQ
jgi:hypothetical protein